MQYCNQLVRCWGDELLVKAIKSLKYTSICVVVVVVVDVDDDDDVGGGAGGASNVSIGLR